MSLTIEPAVTPERQAFYERIDVRSMTPLWTVLSTVVTPEPKSACQPHLWNYDELRGFLIEAGGLITAKEAERRVLILENPGLRGQAAVTTSLYAGLQLVMPGECAPAHRHSQSALRFMLETSGGAFTAVNGERTEMAFGDFIITPPWSWHDHENKGDEPTIWLDGLDLPMVTHFDASFAEEFGADSQPVTKVVGDSNARYGANMLPVDFAASRGASPIFNYPYARSREALENLKTQGELDPCHGIKLRYVSPSDGGFAMPTIATFLQLLPKGFQTMSYRSTDATVFVVAEGSGTSTIDGMPLTWRPRDIFVVPSWREVRHVAAEEAVLFSFSDRAAQDKLGFFRERRGNQ